MRNGRTNDIQTEAIPVDYDEVEAALGPFYERGLIQDVLYVVKSGKEATVYCCRAGDSAGMPALAAKVYRPRTERGFHHDAMYREGRVVGKARDRRAMAKMTDHGREVAFGAWVAHEFETLRLLYAAHADVPRPVASASNAILMGYVGDEESAAQHLRSVSLSREEAPRVFRRVMKNIEGFLACDRIHADLSPYNILYWQGRITVIDFPQAVIPHCNRNARDLLFRDVENICNYFQRFGVECDPYRITGRLWSRYLRAELVAPAA